MCKLISCFFFLFFCSIFLSAGGSGPFQNELGSGYVTESYNKLHEENIYLTPSATGSFQINAPVSRFSIWFEAAASFTFNTATLTVHIASESFGSYLATTPLLLQPQELSSGTFIHFHNGPATQTIRYRSLGRQNFR